MSTIHVRVGNARTETVNSVKEAELYGEFVPTRQLALNVDSAHHFALRDPSIIT